MKDLDEQITEHGYKIEALEARINEAIANLDQNIRAEHNCLTGQEWYDRFERELEKVSAPPQVLKDMADHGRDVTEGIATHIESEVLRAAKRAAGLE